MTQLLQETNDFIRSIGKTPEDIAFIGSADGEYGCTWYEFNTLAAFQYDSGYGAQEVPNDLVIIFNDLTYMTRGEYDGLEWWNYHKPIQIPELYLKIVNLKELDSYMSWQSVAERQVIEEN